MVDNITVEATSDTEADEIADPQKSLPSRITEEKVEVLIKEVIRIKPGDFSAFKHALEEFVEYWDK